MIGKLPQSPCWEKGSVNFYVGGEEVVKTFSNGGKKKKNIRGGGT